jgi:hypothetical protein
VPDDVKLNSHQIINALNGFKVMADNHLSAITLKPILTVFIGRDSGLIG